MDWKAIIEDFQLEDDELLIIQDLMTQDEIDSIDW